MDGWMVVLYGQRHRQRTASTSVAYQLKYCRSRRKNAAFIHPSTTSWISSRITHCSSVLPFGRPVVWPSKSVLVFKHLSLFVYIGVFNIPIKHRKPLRNTGGQQFNGGFGFAYGHNLSRCSILCSSFSSSNAKRLHLPQHVNVHTYLHVYVCVCMSVCLFVELSKSLHCI